MPGNVRTQTGDEKRCERLLRLAYHSGMRPLALIPTLVALLASPASAFTCPAEGGSEWREYKTAHFLLDTDVSRFKAEILLKDLEQLRALVVQGLFGEQVEVAGHMRVLVPGSFGHYQDLAGSPTRGAFFKTTGWGDALIVMPIEGRQGDRELVAHEVAHYLSYYQFPEQPSWFAEGLAHFFQTVASAGKESAPALGSHVIRGASTLGGGVGLLSDGLVLQFGSDRRPLRARELFDWSGEEREDSPARYHAWSWILYHWLWSQRSAQFGKYQKQLADGEAPKDAWVAAFPEFDPQRPTTLEKLDEELVRYERGRRYLFYKVSAPSTATYVDAPLSSADVHLLLAHGRYDVDPAGRARQRADLDAAVREDALNAQALYERERSDGKMPAAEKVRAIVKARPADARAWSTLAEVTNDGAERTEALRKAAQLNPEDGRTQMQLARALLDEGRSKEALSAANRALDLAPWHPAMIETLTNVAATLGKCPEALKLGKRADRVFSEWSREGSSQAHKRYLQLEERCAGSASP
jgi:tetratricopeptide (TPR) repeat protein